MEDRTVYRAEGVKMGAFGFILFRLFIVCERPFCSFLFSMVKKNFGRSHNYRSFISIFSNSFVKFVRSVIFFISLNDSNRSSIVHYLGQEILRAKEERRRIITLQQEGADAPGRWKGGGVFLL